jgi:hypothetical protein
MGINSSSAYLQDRAIGACPEPDESSPHSHNHFCKIVVCRAVTGQRPPDKQIYNSPY